MNSKNPTNSTNPMNPMNSTNPTNPMSIPKLEKMAIGNIFQEILQSDFMAIQSLIYFNKGGGNT